MMIPTISESLRWNILKTFISFYLIIISFLFSGCFTTAGEKFSYQPYKNSLELRKTTSKEVTQTIGKPYKNYSSTTNEGNFTIYKYEYDKADAEAVEWRVLVLTFKSDTLVSIAFNSNFNEDETNFNYTASQKIKIDESTKDSVLQFLGPPSYKMTYFPHAGDFKETKCDSADFECAWFYQAMTVNHKTGKWKSVKVLFNKNGFVCDMQASKEN